MKALVVDDNETFRTQTARYLGLHDIDVDTAASGEAALQAMHGRGYDVVLLDLKMPDMHGLDVLRKARDDGVHSSFIVVTGYGDVQSAVEAMKTGAVDFIEKPFDPEHLLELIRETHASHREQPHGAERLQSLLETRGSAAVLLIAVQPRQLEKSLSFTADEHLALEENDPSLSDITGAIAAFMEHNDEAFIVHAGIRHLLEQHDAAAVERYLADLHRRAAADDVTLLVLYDPSLEHDIMHRIADDTDAALFVEEVIATLDHPIRREILDLLEHNKVLPYTFFLKHMDIEYSAKLAFHIKRLQDGALIEKTGEGYTLTERGHSFARLYRSLLLQRHRDAGANVLYYPITDKQ